MLANKLHINMSKCCFSDFKPSEDSIADVNDFIIKINEHVSEATFLSVKIDENLKWSSHIRQSYSAVLTS